MSYAVPSGIWQVDSFARCLSLRDLAGLSCARKDWQASIVSVYSSPDVQQLVQALKTCLPDMQRMLASRMLQTAHLTVPSFSQPLRQLWKTVSFLQARSKAPWGPAIAAAPGLHEDITQLFTVPQLPFELKIHFVKHMGLRISCQHLMAAAYQQVSEVEQWVLVQESQGIRPDLPHVVLVICGHDGDLQLDQLHSITSQEKEDILQLAFNLMHHCSNAKLVIAELTSKVTDPAKLQQLLETAIVRGHREALHLAVSSPAASQLASSAVLQLMQAVSAITFTSTGGLLQSLVKLPAAATLGTDSLVPLLQQAVVKSCATSIEALCSLPAAHHTPLDDLISMLDKTVGWRPCTAICALCSLSAAAALTASDIMRLMSKATKEAGYLGIKMLCTLPAAQHLSLRFYSKMLQWAATHSCPETLEALCSLQAAAQVDAASWIQLVQQSLRCSERYADILCSMPAAVQASPADFPAVLKVALQHKRWLALKALCQLPPAQQIHSEQIPGLVQLLEVTPPKRAYAYGYAYTSGSCYTYDSITNALQLLASLGSVQDMSAADFLALIKVLVQRNCSSEDMLQLWFKSRAAHEMSMDILIQHMQEAIYQKDCNLLEALCRVPAAARMCNVNALLQLIDNAIKVSSVGVSRVLQVLSKLPAAVCLSSRQLAGVLSAAVKRGISLPSQLCDVPAASMLPTAKVADLVQAAMKSGHIFDVKLLCSMQVSNCLSSDVIKKLLLAVLDMMVEDMDRGEEYDEDDEDVYDVCDNHDYEELVTLLCSLNGAAEITSIGVLLSKALRKRRENVIQQLCQLPAAKNVTADALVYYLDKAVRMNSEAAVQSLCELPNANCIQKKGVLQLIQTAVHMSRTYGIPSLCQLRAAHRLSPGTLLTLLQQLAVKQWSAGASLAVIQLLRRVLRAKRYFGKCRC